MNALANHLAKIDIYKPPVTHRIKMSNRSEHGSPQNYTSVFERLSQKKITTSQRSLKVD